MTEASKVTEGVRETSKRVRRSPWKWVGLYGALIVVVVGSVLGVAVLRGPTHAKLLYYQYHAARFQLPGDQVVYRFSPVLDGASDPTSFFGVPIAAVAPPELPAEVAGSADDEDCQLLPPHVVPAGGVGESSDVDMYNRYLNYALTDNMQVLLSHELKSAWGARRIVMVEFGPDPRPVTQKVAFEILVIEPATFSAAPRVMTRQRLAASDLGIAYGGTTCYAGQVDQMDGSVFHLALEQRGVRKTLIGTLQPDGRHVELRPDAAAG